MPLKAVHQSRYQWLTLRYRGQAPSHIWVVSGIATGPAPYRHLLWEGASPTYKPDVVLSLMSLPAILNLPIAAELRDTAIKGRQITPPISTSR